LYIRRAIEDSIESINKTFPVLLVTGPRQVGKTTMLKQLARPDQKYITLDHPTIRQLAKTDPGLFLDRYPPPIIIDEVQYAPELFDYIKIYVDEHKRNGDFWLTGSQTFHMMKNVTESLAGRVGIVKMSGLSNAEVRGNVTLPFEVDKDYLLSRLAEVKKMSVVEVFDRIFKGSMPRLYESPETNREEYYESYIETYISRDIRDLTQVADELNFLRFITIVAARTATNVNYETLASETGITSPTAKQWLSILVSNGLVLLIDPYFNNTLKRIIKAPRMFFLDTGLCAYLTKWNSAEALEVGAMNGQFFETWVVSELYKSYIHSGKRPPFSFYRDSNQREIDLILEKNNTLYPVEIKKNSAPREAVKSFTALDDNKTVGSGAVICMSQDVIPIDNRNWYVPAWLI
jgi:predicted AAA+ superfamily ATPase